MSCAAVVGGELVLRFLLLARTRHISPLTSAAVVSGVGQPDKHVILLLFLLVARTRNVSPVSSIAIAVGVVRELFVVDVEAALYRWLGRMGLLDMLSAMAVEMGDTVHPLPRELGAVDGGDRIPAANCPESPRHP